MLEGSSGPTPDTKEKSSIWGTVIPKLRNLAQKTGFIGKPKVVQESIPNEDLLPDDIFDTSETDYQPEVVNEQVVEESTPQSVYSEYLLENQRSHIVEQMKKRGLQNIASGSNMSAFVETIAFKRTSNSEVISSEAIPVELNQLYQKINGVRHENFGSIIVPSSPDKDLPEEFKAKEDEVAASIYINMPNGLILKACTDSQGNILYLKDIKKYKTFNYLNEYSEVDRDLIEKVVAMYRLDNDIYIDGDDAIVVHEVEDEENSSGETRNLSDIVESRSKVVVVYRQNISDRSTVREEYRRVVQGFGRNKTYFVEKRVYDEDGNLLERNEIPAEDMSNSARGGLDVLANLKDEVIHGKGKLKDRNGTVNQKNIKLLYDASLAYINSKNESNISEKSRKTRKKRKRKESQLN